MTSLKNVLEEIVIVEVQAQLQHLSPKAREAINLSEVTAFALNRLPVLYASTSRGWLQQRKRAHNELHDQIVSEVKHALLGVKQDPLRKSTQIVASKVETPAHVLAKLQKLFDKSNLLWNGVPQAFQDAIASVAHAPEYANLSISDRHRLHDVKGYLQRKGTNLYPYRDGQNRDGQNRDGQNQDWQNRDWQNNVELPNPELTSYILSASYFLINVLEDLVKQEVTNQLIHMETVLPRKVGVDDVSAYVLNRLPAMYATTEQGMIWQSQKAKEHLSRQIETTVIQSLMTLGKTPRRLTDPIPLLKFEQECEEAISELRLIFQRDDITWRNIAPMAEYAIAHEKQGLTYWRQQWRMLGQIYSEMYLKSGDGELSLSQTTEGEILIVRTYTKAAFGWLADNPKNLGVSTLRLFPAVAAIELHAFFLDFAITYTREEMAIDGIV